MSVPFYPGFCMFCAYIRPRYQVNIYRTIRPLVILSEWFLVFIFRFKLYVQDMMLISRFGFEG